MDHTRFAPAHSNICFLGLHCSGSRVLCRTLSKVCPTFHALPRSKLLRFRFLGHRFCWAQVFAFPRFEQLEQPGAW